MVAEDVIFRALELLVDAFDGFKIFDGLGLVAFWCCIFEVAKLDEEIDFFFVHQLDTFSHLIE